MKIDLHVHYVGRVSKEKNIHLLAEDFRNLVSEGIRVHLLIVGDGPYYEEMKKDMNGLPCYFTGYLNGEKLSEIYTSSDLFVFPSATDTFGNVVLEAQASGLPVIVTDHGGPCENIIPDETGLVVEADNTQSLLSAMRRLAVNSTLCRAMGLAARRYSEARSFESAFLRTWEMFDKQQPELMSRAG